MTWVRIDDRFPGHPKIMALTDRAFRAHVTGICYSAEYETDGFVPNPVAKRAGSRSAIAQLLELGLWHSDTGGFQIHDYLEYNPSRTEQKARRQQTADRQARFRGSRTVTVDNAAIWERDKGICGICGEPANEDDWQLDHVMPIKLGGKHDPSNVQVSHPKCNASKQHRVTRDMGVSNDSPSRPVPSPSSLPHRNGSTPPLEKPGRDQDQGKSVLPKRLAAILDDKIAAALTRQQAEVVAAAWQANDVELRQSMAKVESAANPAAYLVSMCQRITGARA